MYLWKIKLLVISLLVLVIMSAGQDVLNADTGGPYLYKKGEAHVSLGNGREGKVNWETKYITARGIMDNPTQGMVLSRRGAIVDAQRNLLEIIKGVHINSETIVSDSMVSEVIKTQVKGLLKHSEIVKEEWDGSVYEVTMRVPMGTIVKIFKKQKKTKIAVNPDTVKKRVVTPVAFTGLVIDAREYNVTPSIFIKIYNTSGKIVCGPIHPIYRVSNMDIEEIEEEGIGRRPLRITAGGITGTHDVDIIINDEDAREIKESIMDTDVLSRNNVIILID